MLNFRTFLEVSNNSLNMSCLWGPPPFIRPIISLLVTCSIMMSLLLLFRFCSWKINNHRTKTDRLLPPRMPVLFNFQKKLFGSWPKPNGGFLFSLPVYQVQLHLAWSLCSLTEKQASKQKEMITYLNSFLKDILTSFIMPTDYSAGDESVTVCQGLQIESVYQYKSLYSYLRVLLL